MKDQPLLNLSGLSKSFGPNIVLDKVDFNLFSGEVQAIVGENGAGKSTLIKILSGAYKPDSGKMFIGGSEYRPASPLDGRKQGIAVIYQELNLAPHLTVEENIMLGQEESKLGLVDTKRSRDKIQKVLEFLHHPEISPDIPVRKLTIGARQVVEIARALISQARILVMDEPTSSLSQEDTRRLFEIIRKLKNEGVGLIYVSHFLEEVLEIADRFTVLRDGKVAGYGQISQTSVEELIQLMIGRRISELYPRLPHQAGEVILNCSEIKSSRMNQPINLELRRGEILGIAGLVGSGRTEFLRALFGLDRLEKGLVIISGKEFRPEHPQASIRRGLGLLSEDRQVEGLALRMNLADNLTLSHLTPYVRLGFLNSRKQKEATSFWISRVNIKAFSPEQKVWTLSGGNQQKVALARLLHQEAGVFLLDEPTRGIDVMSKAQIYELMGKLAADNKAVI
ncbi:MAG: sugar ABC transporter ATP-binding protein, partial [Candidatus Saccharicenans sp.]